jgi:DNA-binding transcriptional regulator YhcF (GntR family)
MLNQYAIIRALETISNRPQSPMSVRQLAKFAKISPAMASIAFDYFKGADLIKIEQIGRTYQFHANLQNPLMREWKILFTLNHIQKSI